MTTKPTTDDPIMEIAKRLHETLKFGSDDVDYIRELLKENERFRQLEKTARKWLADHEGYWGEIPKRYEALYNHKQAILALATEPKETV